MEKVMMRKVATSRKRKTHNRQSKTKPISVCECLIVIFKMLCSCFIFKQARNMIFFHFIFLSANLRGGKGGTLMVGPGGTWHRNATVLVKLYVKRPTVY